jgi:hypothetical protein
LPGFVFYAEPRRSGEEMQFFAWLETYSFSGCDGDFGSGTWIASNAGFARLDGEYAKASEFNAIPCNEGLLHAVEDRVNGSLCLGSGEAGTFHNPLYKVLLNHLGRRPW